jgi:hypothetical protein
MSGSPEMVRRHGRHGLARSGMRSIRSIASTFPHRRPEHVELSGTSSMTAGTVLARVFMIVTTERHW